MEQVEDRENENESVLSIPADIAHFYRLGVLDTLLLDHTTGNNIVWATDTYEHRGEGFGAKDTIAAFRIIGPQGTPILRRAQKERVEQASLTKAHAEVFTPAWVCAMMIDHADQAWMKDQRVGDLGDSWRAYVNSPRLEITCGEAPYLANRYDAESGEAVPVEERIGILDRKLRLITAHTERRQDWMLWAYKAVKAVYGYEFQGDNLLIARINMVRSVEDHLAAAGHEPLREGELHRLADIVSWNLWQMDGLEDTIPFGHIKEDLVQASLFDEILEDEENTMEGTAASLIKNWKTGEDVEFRGVRGGRTMKFDYVIGNPPYQEESRGGERE